MEILKISEIFLSLVGSIVGIILIIVGLVESFSIGRFSFFIFYGMMILLFSIIVGWVRLSRYKNK